MRSVINAVHGKFQGKAEFWYENGHKKWEAGYVDGKPVTTTYWDENGVKNTK
jgi:antitoxin component YwqK of YwqJK toxin-antitoxin module